MELEPSVEGNRREGGSLNRGLRAGVQESVRLVASIWSHGLSSIGDVDEEEHGWMSYEQPEGNTGLQRMLWMSSDPRVKLVHRSVDETLQQRGLIGVGTRKPNKQADLDHDGNV